MRPIPVEVGLFVAMIGMLFVVSGCGQPDGPGAGRSGLMIEGRYEIRGSEGDVVFDTVTGLEWQRCSLGQSWDGRTCTSEAFGHNIAVLTGVEAWQAADDVADWRLPAIDELRTLVYCSSGQPERFKTSDEPCEGDFRPFGSPPTIVSEAFPNTPSSNFWSGSPYTHDSSVTYIVSFWTGSASGMPPEIGLGRVRLVRGGL